MVLVGLRPPLHLQAEVVLYREQLPQRLQLEAVAELATRLALFAIRLPQAAVAELMVAVIICQVQREILVVMVVTRASATSQVVAVVQELTVRTALLPRTPRTLTRTAVLGSQLT